LKGADCLRRINPHVLEDIEDGILLDGFKEQKDIRGIPDIEKRIQEILTK